MISYSNFKSDAKQIAQYLKDHKSLAMNVTLWNIVVSILLYSQSVLPDNIFIMLIGSFFLIVSYGVIGFMLYLHGGKSQIPYVFVSIKNNINYILGSETNYGYHYSMSNNDGSY